MSDERDHLIARALDDVEVPAYSAGFWDRLEGRLEQERRAAPASADGPIPDRGRGDVVPIALGTDERLVPLRRARRGGGTRALAVAAAVALAVLATWHLRPEGDEVRTASPPARTGPTTHSTAGTNTTTSAGAPAADVLVWIEAIAAGDIDAAVERTGPRTAAYYEALEADLRGVMVEYGEGYGAWADSPDRETDVLSLGEVGGQAVVAVVLSGTWNGEGGPLYRVQAIPAVQAERGGPWLVEPAAFDPFSEGRLLILSPPSGEGGLGGLPADGVVKVSGDRGGVYWFSIDGAEPARFERPGGEDAVTFDPDDEILTSGTHVLVVAQVDEQNITAEAATFTVEG